jgi:hypothetical protein
MIDDCASMPIKPRDLEDLLVNKFNFSPAKGHSSDHRWYELRLPGLPVIATYVSHGKEEIRDKLEGKIIRQLRVRKTYFQGMISCSNNRADYYKQVRDDPYPSWGFHF